MNLYDNYIVKLYELRNVDNIEKIMQGKKNEETLRLVWNNRYIVPCGELRDAQKV